MSPGRLASFLLVIPLAGCGVGSLFAPSLACGADTVLVGSECRPASLVACGPGTHLESGACLPDSHVTCGAGTVETDGGQCAPAAIRCGAGTEAVEGVCVVADPMKRVTVPERAEPNLPPGKSTRFTLPAIGEAPVVLGGTIDTAGAQGPDFDGFIFHAERMTRVRIEPAAVGLPVAAFTLVPCKSKRTDVCEVDDEMTFHRFGLTIDGRAAVRELVLPAEADYLLVVSEQSNFAESLPMGGEAFTYTVNITQLAQPAASPLTPGQSATGSFDALLGHSFTVTEAAPLYDLELAPQQDDDPFYGQRALWAVDAAGELVVSTEDPSYGGMVFAMNAQRACFAPGTARVFVDYVMSVVDRPDYSLTVREVPVKPVPSGVPFHDDATFAKTQGETYALELGAGSVLVASVTIQAGQYAYPRIELRDSRYRPVLAANGKSFVRHFDTSEAGRYYLTVSDQYWSASSASVKFGLDLAVASAEPVGPVALSGAPSVLSRVLPAEGESWFAVYAANDGAFTVSVKPSITADASLELFTSGSDLSTTRLGAGGPGVTEQDAPRFVQSGGVIAVRVSGAAGDTFDLTITGEAAQGEHESNDTPALATPVTLDPQGDATIHATLATEDDMDHFAFDVVTAGTVTVETAVLPGRPPIDTVLSLYGARNQWLGSNDECPGKPLLSCISATLTPGRYQVRAEVFGYDMPAGAGAYTVRISTPP